MRSPILRDGAAEFRTISIMQCGVAQLESWQAVPPTSLTATQRAWPAIRHFLRTASEISADFLAHPVSPSRMLGELRHEISGKR